MYDGSRSRSTAQIVSGSTAAAVGPQAVVADQLDGARHRFVGVDDGAGDPRHLQQHRLDLGQLDPIAADLDLEVDPAVVLDLARAR